MRYENQILRDTKINILFLPEDFGITITKLERIKKLGWKKRMNEGTKLKKKNTDQIRRLQSGRQWTSVSMQNKKYSGRRKKK